MKIVLYFLKTLAVNIFIAWQLKKCEHYLHTLAQFGRLDRFRETLGRRTSFSDWLAQVIEELLDYADVMEGGTGPDGSRECRLQRPPSDLIIPKRNRILFFNGRIGRSHRLSTSGHCTNPRASAGWCVFCRNKGSSGEHKGRQEK